MKSSFLLIFLMWAIFFFLSELDPYCFHFVYRNSGNLFHIYCWTKYPNFFFFCKAPSHLLYRNASPEGPSCLFREDPPKACPLLFFLQSPHYHTFSISLNPIPFSFIRAFPWSWPATWRTQEDLQPRPSSGTAGLTWSPTRPRPPGP